MISAAALDADLDRLYGDFSNDGIDLFDADGNRVRGFFATALVARNGLTAAMVGQHESILNTNARLAQGSRLTDRRHDRTWVVVGVQGNEGAFQYTLRDAVAHAAQADYQQKVQQHWPHRVPDE